VVDRSDATSWSRLVTIKKPGLTSNLIFELQFDGLVDVWPYLDDGDGGVTVGASDGLKHSVGGAVVALDAALAAVHRSYPAVTRIWILWHSSQRGLPADGGRSAQSRHKPWR
jgi:hypothetical protein